ncbi:histidine phosphatase family protein [Sphingomonas spermidinifaciens]|uniref:Histidine phosphatase family protein n=1 Tax=Sphingomonas spermidinifaciens TaxID=1141889 RepID=A0A2A4B5Y8_9SPHN|nr:phosphoglycerate mutase family protein [Sphingomonas spermidinifaciens]PCD03178.1 histidine phosphatase family protein [Sphingomonas spermidinifaciens]
MRRRAVLAFTAALLTAGCAGTPAPQTIYVIRHLDTPEGVKDARLTSTGEARAQALVRWFGGKKLAAIYATPFARTRQTAAPLARERGLQPIDYDWTDAARLVEAVRVQPGDVLIVGHSNTVPEIVERFGGQRPAPLVHVDFGDLWLVREGRSERVKIEP